MADRLITVTEGLGADFTKVEMTESEFNAKFRKGQTDEVPLQTEYDQAAIKGENEDQTEDQTEENEAKKVTAAKKK
jgi:hypothetical protein